MLEAVSRRGFVATAAGVILTPAASLTAASAATAPIVAELPKSQATGSFYKQSAGLWRWVDQKTVKPGDILVHVLCGYFGNPDTKEFYDGSMRITYLQVGPKAYYVDEAGTERVATVFGEPGIFAMPTAGLSEATVAPVEPLIVVREDTAPDKIYHYGFPNGSWEAIQRPRHHFDYYNAK